MFKYKKISQHIKSFTYSSIFIFLLFSLILLPVVSFVFEYFFESSFNLLLPTFAYLATVAIVSPIVEETGKISTFLFLRKQNKPGDNTNSNLLMLVAIGFLFGITENTLFLLSASFAFPSIEILNRILNGQILHTVAPAFFFPNKKNRLRKSANYRIIFPITIHSIWNLMIYFEVNVIFIYLFSLLLIIYLILKIKRL